jgi:hypothetical protein
LLKIGGAEFQCFSKSGQDEVVVDSVTFFNGMLLIAYRNDALAIENKKYLFLHFVLVWFERYSEINNVKVKYVDSALNSFSAMSSHCVTVPP